jgi:hypothetical protein
MINVIVLVGCLVLVSCSARFPATIIMQNKILRGSATGIFGDIVNFSVNNAEGLSCEGKMLVLSSGANTEGIIDCSNKRKGNFIANGRKASWVGEGTLDDGSRFVISISR